MPDKKLTDSEIVKALEWCEHYENNIVSVWKSDKKYTLALQTMQTIKNVLKDFNRLQAENESLFLKNQKLLITMLWGNKKDKKTFLNQIKAEAYKEFAKKLKHKAINIGVNDSIVSTYAIDNLLKELGCEDK